MPASHPYKHAESLAEGSSPKESTGSPPDDASHLDDARATRVRLPSKASKRIRGEIACAECRRLKIRCDKIVPCSTCVKRGCTSLCPNGTIPPGQGSRFVLAATEHLRRNISKLEARMHSLEDALAIASSSTSNIPHPLLNVQDLEEWEEEEPTLKPVMEDFPLPPSTDGPGTLLIDDDGASRFFGSSGPEGILMNPQAPEPLPPTFTSYTLPELDPSYLPPEVNQFCQSFPFTPPAIPIGSIQSSIESFLPPVGRAIALCETFLEHLSWMFQIVTRQQLINELIPVIYKQKKASYGPHDLALMLCVLGIGALVDLTLEPYNLEAQHYYRLARAAATLQPVLAEQSVVTIKVLHLMSIYNGMSGKESNLEQSYALLNLAGQVALRIGFHVDPSMWGFTGKEAYERRVYFWNLLQGSLWQSLVTGRPPFILSTSIDCKIPTPEEENIFQQGEVPLGFGIWGFRSSSEGLLPVVRAILAAKPPTYEKVLELDSKIRKLALPISNADPLDNRTALSMRTFVRSHYQDLMLLFLHRAFFAQAMAENPKDPLASPYSKSIIAAYQSACVVLEDTRVQFLKKPLLCTRIWRIWTFAFSAALVVGTVAMRGPDFGLSPPPLEQFEVACSVFQSAAETNSRAARALPVLQAMLRKASQSGTSRDGEVDRKTRRTEESSVFGGPATSSKPQIETVVARPSGKRPSTSHIPPIQIPHVLPHLPSQRSGVSPTHHRSPPLSYTSDGRATFADLSQGWDGLFHETPSLAPGMSYLQPAPSYPVNNGYGEGAMLDDRWSSFMHNYSILNDPRPPS